MSEHGDDQDGGSPNAQSSSDPLPPPPPLPTGGADATPTGKGAPDNVAYALMGSAALVAIGSLFSFYELDLGGSAEDDFGAALFGSFIETSWTAWSNAWSLFPLVTVSVLLVILAGVALALERLTSIELPDRLQGPTAVVGRTVAGLLGLVTVLAYVLRPLLDFSDGDDTIQIGVGGWVILIGTLGFLVATILQTRSESDPPARAAAAPTETSSSMWVLLGSAVVVIGGSFLPVLGASGGLGELGESTGAEHAWVEGSRPVFGLPAIAAAALLVIVLMTRAKGPVVVRSLGLGAGALKLTIAGYAAFAALALLIGNPVFGGFDNLVEAKVGHFLMLVGALGLVAGCLMERSSQSSA